MARTGRRPGNQDTREVILAAARTAFAERGYDKASIRQIATGAGVDPALVHHYFGAKDQLFLAAMDAPVDPGKIIAEVVAAGDLDGLGERLLRRFLAVWDSPAGVTAAAIVRSAVSHDWSARMLREFLSAQILRHIAGHIDLDPTEAPLRAGLVASQLMGLIMARYIIRIEPIENATGETLIATVAPTIQRYLTGPLAGLEPGE